MNVCEEQTNNPPYKHHTTHHKNKTSFFRRCCDFLSTHHWKMAEFAAGATGERRMQRALTGKYDLAEMNKFIKLSEVVNASLASVCGCSEDDLEVDVDLYSIYKKPAEERRALIVSNNLM